MRYKIGINETCQHLFHFLRQFCVRPVVDHCDTEFGFYYYYVFLLFRTNSQSYPQGDLCSSYNHEINKFGFKAR